MMSTCKFKQIVSSIHEIALIESLLMIKPYPSAPRFLLLEGNLLVLALKELGSTRPLTSSERTSEHTPTIFGSTGSQRCRKIACDAARQIVADEPMIAANKISAVYADAFLWATPPKQRTN